MAAQYPRRKTRNPPYTRFPSTKGLAAVASPEPKAFEQDCAFVYLATLDSQVVRDLTAGTAPGLRGGRGPPGPASRR